jgi:RNA polymerase sigma factor (sigma-70 family)
MEVFVANDQTNSALGQFLRLWNEHEAAGKSDGQLLAQFVNQHDDQAFAALMSRHGIMVISVCRRILGNAADADDAFQATFLVFVRKAKSLLSRRLLGDWLHAVARRAALKVKSAAARRRLKEQAMARSEAQGEETRDDWLPLLDEELSRLPEKYRLPIILCDLEGRTRQEAARQLDWPEGTVAGRLARGREMLHKRLLRRGVTLSLAALSAALAQKTALAALPATLVTSTIKAAALVAAGQIAADGVISAKVATLTGEVMKTMLLSKLKTLAAIVVVCALGGFGWVALGGAGSGPVAVAQDGAKKKVPDKESEKKDQEKTVENKKESLTKPQANESKKIVKNMATSKEVIADLQELLDMRPFQAEMTLDETLGLISQQFFNKGKEIIILINDNAFKEENPDMPPPNETVVKFPAFPAKMTAALVLERAISKISSNNAELQIRSGVVYITTWSAVAKSLILNEKVMAIFENRPLAEVVEDLADQSGVSINIDPRVGDKATFRITATFRNDVTIGGALRTVTNMAGLKVVNMKSGLYITTPANAKELEDDLKSVPHPATHRPPPPAAAGA